MKRFLLLLILIGAIVTPGCSEDETNPTEPASPLGSLYVQVVDTIGRPVPQAEVWFADDDRTWTTEAPGDLLIENLGSGFYEVWADRGSAGAGMTSTIVERGALSEVRINLDPEAGVRPVLELFSSLGTQSYAESVRVVVSGSDPQDPPDSLTVSWSSNLDGELGTTRLSPDRWVHLSALLSRGTHELEFTLTDRDEHVSRVERTLSCIDLEPTVQIRRPFSEESFLAGDSIDFEARIRDAETPWRDLTLRWSSDLDGVLDETPPDSTGASSFSTAALSEGEHRIFLSGVDGENQEVVEERTITVRGASTVQLEPIETTSRSNLLRWTATARPDFQMYVVFRRDESGFDRWITSIDSPDVRSYEDKDIELGRTYEYWIRVHDSEGVVNDSNHEAGRPGLSIDLGRPIGVLIADPSRPFVYAAAEPGDAVFLIEEEGRSLVTIELPDRDVTDLDVGASGELLYAIDFAQNEILEIDLSDGSIERTLPLEPSGLWGDHLHVEAGRAGRLYWVDANWEPRLHILDLETGAEIAELEDLGVGDLEITPDGNSLVLWSQHGWTSQYSTTRLYQFSTQEDPPTFVQGGGPDLRQAPLDTPIFVVDEGRTVVCKLASYPLDNFTAGRFPYPKPIYAATPDGTRVFSEDRIRLGSDGTATSHSLMETRRQVVSAGGRFLYVQKEDATELYWYEFDLVRRGGR